MAARYDRSSESDSSDDSHYSSDTSEESLGLVELFQGIRPYRFEPPAREPRHIGRNNLPQPAEENRANRLGNSDWYV